MVLLVLLVGLLVAVWPTPVLRIAGRGAGATTGRVRLLGAAVAVVALATALLIGP